MTSQLANKEYLLSLCRPLDIVTFQIDRFDLEELVGKIAANFSRGQYAPRQVKRIESSKGVRVQPATLADTLLLRHCSRRLRDHRGTALPSRHQITSQLLTILKSDVRHSVFRTDIKRFYSSISAEQPLLESAVASSLSADELAWCRTLLQSTPTGMRELPQGLSISAELSEYVMRDFDIQMTRLPGVVFYARFVDDIIAVTAGGELRLHADDVAALLPLGLLLNRSKTHCCRWSDARASKHEFTYLGYSFRLRDRVRSGKLTEVRVSLAEKKVRKIERRIARTISSYAVNRDLPLLRDRIKFLTGGCTYRSVLKHRASMTSLHRTYPLVNDFGCLQRLDSFLGFRLRSARNQSRSALFSRSTLRNLRKYSFAASFRTGIRHSFSGSRLRVVLDEINYV